MVWAALVAGVVAGTPDVETFHPVVLVAIALAAYAWVLYPIGGSVAVSLLVLLAVAWAWGMGQHRLLALDLAALAVLVVVAAFQCRRWSRRFQRLHQVLDDVSEEQTVKDQALTLATQALEALHKKHARYAQLQAIAEQLSNMTDLEAIGQLAVERAFTLIGKSDVCLLFVVDKERQELSLFASKKREALGAIRAKHGDQFDRYVLRTQRPLFVNDVRRDFRFTVSVSADRTVSSVIACPLMMGQTAEGVLRLDSSRPGTYTQDDLRLLDILLHLIATGMTNARLFERTQQLAMLDGLTGLMLRRPFLEQLARELTRAGRSRESASVLMLDVDHFKDYNDTYGHTAGDVVLKSVAEVLRAAVPSDALCARYGGEEFAVLLPRTKRPQAGDIAETIRKTVEHQVQGSGREPARALRQGEAAGHPRPVTVSIGAASFPDDAQADLELIRVADQRLYQAKGAGRNVVCAA
jgi:diguanylate cyclase (GGDEF)-like protein